MANDEAESVDKGDSNAKNCCTHKCCCSVKHCWIKGLGLIAILALIIGLCCHHSHGYHETHQHQNEASQSVTK